MGPNPWRERMVLSLKVAPNSCFAQLHVIIFHHLKSLKHTELNDILSLSESFFDFQVAISTLGEPIKQIGSNYIFQVTPGKFDAVKLIVHNDIVDHVSVTLCEPVNLAQIESVFGQSHTLVEDFKNQLRYTQFRSGAYVFRFLIPDGGNLPTNDSTTEFDVTRADHSIPL